jgi:NAD(P)-dependent dehydrogenase (short-subunit alcohol dehydrogenase family)
MKHQHQNVIVTGASQGLGAEIARYFVREGANVAICSRGVEIYNTHNDLKALATTNQKIFVRQVDVSDEVYVNAFVSDCIRLFAEVHAVINNAGVYGPFGAIETVDMAQWRRAFEINLFGTIYPCRAILPHFRERSRGKIVNISGGGATKPMPFISSYAASKAAVVRFTETLAKETAADNINVNAIAPGALNTRLLDEIIQAGPEVVGTDFYKQSLKQRDTGGDSLLSAAECVGWLVSPASGNLSGKLISAKWDNWRNWSINDITRINNSDLYTLRRYTVAE